MDLLMANVDILKSRNPKTLLFSFIDVNDGAILFFRFKKQSWTNVTKSDVYALI